MCARVRPPGKRQDHRRALWLSLQVAKLCILTSIFSRGYYLHCPKQSKPLSANTVPELLANSYTGQF